MKLRKVKPSQIKWPELRVTARFDEETRQILRDSIKQVGIITPIICQVIDGEIVGCDGLHRCEDAIAEGDQPIDVAILDGDMVDLLCRNLFLDHARGKTPVSDMVKVIGGLYTEYNTDIEVIQTKSGLPRDYLERLIKISQASPEVLFALDQGAIGVGVAFQLSRLPSGLIQEEILAKSTVYRLRVADVKPLVDATLKELKLITEAPPAAPPAGPKPAVVYRCEGCKDEVEPRYLRPVMLCPTCFGRVWRLAQAAEAPKEEVSEETPTP